MEEVYISLIISAFAGMTTAILLRVYARWKKKRAGLALEKIKAEQTSPLKDQQKREEEDNRKRRKSLEAHRQEMEREQLGKKQEEKEGEDQETPEKSNGKKAEEDPEKGGREKEQGNKQNENAPRKSPRKEEAAAGGGVGIGGEGKLPRVQPQEQTLGNLQQQQHHQLSVHLGGGDKVGMMKRLVEGGKDKISRTASARNHHSHHQSEQSKGLLRALSFRRKATTPTPTSSSSSSPNQERNTVPGRIEGSEGEGVVVEEKKKKKGLFNRFRKK